MSITDNTEHDLSDEFKRDEMAIRIGVISDVVFPISGIILLSLAVLLAVKSCELETPQGEPARLVKVAK